MNEYKVNLIGSSEYFFMSAINDDYCRKQLVKDNPDTTYWDWNICIVRRGVVSHEVSSGTSQS